VAQHLPLGDSSPALEPSDWSPDGKVAAVTAVRPKTGADIEIYSFETGELEVYLKTEYDEQTPAFSPDGRWLAYTSDESGENEVYVTAYPGPGGKWQVSRGGGELALWRADGRELYYLGPDHVMAVPVETGDAFRNDTPVALFELPDIVRVDWIDQIYDAAPDGQRFLFLTSREDTAPGTGSVTLLQGWRGLLE
jgi:serine/threonine-protein kinase